MINKTTAKPAHVFAISIFCLGLLALGSAGSASAEVLFEDDFDSGMMSPEWAPQEYLGWTTCCQSVQDGWLHTKDTNGFPRDSMAVVHDSDPTWTDYTVSLTADFVQGTPWDHLNILLKTDNFLRWSGPRPDGSAYQLEFVGSVGWPPQNQNRISLTRTEFIADVSHNISLVGQSWPVPTVPFDIVVSLEGNRIRLWVDSQPVFDVLDPEPLLFGGVGVHAIWEAEARFDNFLVEGIVEVAGPGLVLWNKLGSVQEIENSEVGLNGTITGGGFAPGMFGDAYRADFTQDLLVSFPKEVMPIDAGAIEFWGRIEGLPTNVYWGPQPTFFRLVDGVTNSAWEVAISGNNGLGGGGIVSVAGQWFVATTGPFFSANTVSYEQFLGVGQAEAWHHYALVWDRNGVPGVDGGTRMSAVFLDGQLDSTAFIDGADFVPLTSGTLGLLLIGDGQAPDQGVAFIDNIKIWDFAKIDFSDRFVEGIENEPPVAFCKDVIVSAGANCQASADVDNGSFDPDGDPITLEQSPPGPYGLGTTLVTLTVTDDQGASDSCMATVTVEDTTPPELVVTLTPDTLWPPNHRMVDIEASVVASDVCSMPTTVVLTSVTSNEADNGMGDGNTVNDIQDVDLGTADFDFKLRAERAGGGSGRIYTVIYTATDGSGNETSEAGFVVVPHDQGGITEPIDLLLEENENGTLASWTEVPGAVSYDVIRGQLGQIVETEVVIDLGTVVCIENDSPDTSTLGLEDAALPNPGQSFFYLVAYYDGTSSSYGTESAGKPRAPGAGDCQ